ncbi:glycosyltransferase family 39 protein [Candidatus Woesearchaeota archaeon]|nr:glycosyltransferase family 39 protein [Candidatus Woesearchaeota archaeon]
MKINKNQLIWGLIGVILIIFLFTVKDKITNYSLNTDENSYFYMGKAISEGRFPYGDFFFAHPPVHAYISGIVFKIFGFNFTALKLVPVIAVLISAFFIFRIVGEKFDKTKAILAVILFLFQYNLLRVSTQSAGINLTVMFLVISTYYLFKEKYILSGVFAGFAGITGLYSLVFPVVIGLYLLFSKNKKDIFRFGLGFCLIFVLVNLFFLISYKADYFESVYEFHLKKPKSELSPFYRFSILSVAFQLNIFLFLSAITIFFTKHWKKLKHLIFVSTGFILFLVALPRAFLFYYVLIFPFLAILGSIGFTEVIKKKPLQKYRKVLIGLFMIIIILFSVTKFNRDYVEYDQTMIQEMADYIEVNSAEDDLIFGDYYVVPLLALIADRDLAFDMADTNYMRFKSGITNINDTIKELKQEERLKFVVIEPKRDLAYLEDFVAGFLKTNCELLKIFKADNFGEYYVFDCKI